MTPLEEVLQGGTPLLIPVPEGAYTTQRIALDGRVYTMRLAWNAYAESWFLSLADDQDEPIVTGLRVVTNWPLLRFYRYDERVPPGEIVAMDLTGNDAPPGYDELGKRVTLNYFAQGT